VHKPLLSREENPKVDEVLVLKDETEKRRKLPTAILRLRKLKQAMQVNTRR